ncbi:MAG TPA: hypothetical protein VN823_27640 [Stellaceae bacterium]|nr:hypothetical protein [Stellaceae bacterium]
MLTAHDSADAVRLTRKARSIELQACRSSPTLGAQLRTLAVQYYAAAEAPNIEASRGAAGRAQPRRHCNLKSYNGGAPSSEFNIYI